MKGNSEYGKYAFFVVFALLAYLFYLIAKPYLTYVLLGFIISIGTYPLYKKFHTWTGSSKAAAFLTILVAIVVILIPAFVIVSSILKEVIGFFATFDMLSFQALINSTLDNFGLQTNIVAYVSEFVSSLGKTLTSSTWKILGSIADGAIGILILFTVMYYALTEGNHWVNSMEAFLPFERRRRKVLLDKIKQVIRVVINVELLISLVQGVLGGLVFFIAGIPNPFFWGFVMAVLAFLPFVGTGMVWVPAAIVMIVNGDVAWGIFILIYGIVAIGGIDYVLRPKLVSEGGSIHPVTALVGAFGGLKLLGFAGIVIGPLVAAILEVFIRFHHEDYILSGPKPKKHFTKYRNEDYILNNSAAKNKPKSGN